jgi:tetratricopeptide (TPR) repeat protein
MDPKNPEAYVARGGSYHLLGEHEKGLADRTRAIGLSPGYALAWAARGNAYMILQRYDSALADLTEAERLEPNNPDTRRVRELAQAKVDEIVAHAKAKELAPETGTVILPDVPAPKPEAPPKPEAAPEVRRDNPPAVAAPPTAPAVAPAGPPIAARPVATSATEYHSRGRKLIQEEKYAASIEPLTQAVTLDPFLSQAFNARGYAYFRLKQYKQALADFDQAIKLNPVYTNAYVNRAQVRVVLGDKAGGDSDQAKARDLLKLAK